MSISYAGEEFTFHNPNGSKFKVRGWGDQSKAVFETLDGYTVVKDPLSGFYHYATLSADGKELRAIGITVGLMGAPETIGLQKHIRVLSAASCAKPQAANDILARQRRWERRRELKRAQLRKLANDDNENPQMALPLAGTTGNYVGLCLLVQFPDVPGTITQGQVEDFCNQPGYSGFGNNGSVSDYFEDVSDRKLHYTNRVTTYYTAKHDRAHYTDPNILYGLRAQELIAEALEALITEGFDFSLLSSDGAGFVYALNVFYSGERVNNWAEGLWPHSAALATNYTASPNKTFSDYQITNIGTQLTLRTFCHENGHMICDFPDLYDYGNNSSGIGQYCLMCSGGEDTNPTQFCAYLKYTAGWTSKMTTLAPGMTANVLAGMNDFLMYPRSVTEYFIMENRQQSGRDTALPDEGLAIWHVDLDGSNNYEQMTPSQHYECALEQGDNRFDLERSANLGDVSDLFGGRSAPGFGADTSPNSNWWDGNPSGLEIEHISAPGARMTLNVGYPLLGRSTQPVSSGGDV